jgi:hypothetical protein
MPNWKYSEQVGQGKKHNDVLEVYDAHYGKYDCCDAHEAKLPANKVKGSVYESLPFVLKK